MRTEMRVLELSGDLPALDVVHEPLSLRESGPVAEMLNSIGFQFKDKKHHGQDAPGSSGKF
jgi:hypothetical protein